jgi:hypothetical protein
MIFDDDVRGTVLFPKICSFRDIKIIGKYLGTIQMAIGAKYG